MPTCPPPILHQAKTHASRVFKRAGIEVVWLSDPVLGATVKETPIVNGSADHGLAELHAFQPPIMGLRPVTVIVFLQ